jgi:transposase
MLTQLQISREELETLKYERYHYPCPLVQKRFHAVYIKAVTGFSNERVGEIVDAHRNSISEWVSIYLEGGTALLSAVKYGSNKSTLETQAVGITELFTAHPPRSIAEAAIKIKELTGIGRSPTRIRAFMERHGFRFLKTGHIPAKVNNAGQKDWVGQTLQPVIKAAQDGEVRLLFMDAAHFILQAFLCSLWCVSRVFIKASAGRNRINVLGAVNAITKEVTTYTNTTYICANTLITFLKQLKERYNDKPIAIVLDTNPAAAGFCGKNICEITGHTPAFPAAIFPKP